MATTSPPSRRAIRLRREAWGFAIGSLLFIIGPIPAYASWVGGVGAAWTFVAGAVCFTAAATYQLLLAGRRPPRHGTSRGDALDWWAAAIQLVGTVLFNVSTIAALVVAQRHPDELGAGWSADAWGSLAFLVSSALALGALQRRHELWDVMARTPGAVWLNMIGSIAFGISAVGAYAAPGAEAILNVTWANVGTSIGAVCFLTAALLTRPGATSVSSSPSQGTAG